MEEARDVWRGARLQRDLHAQPGAEGHWLAGGAPPAAGGPQHHLWQRLRAGEHVGQLLRQDWLRRLRPLRQDARPAAAAAGQCGRRLEN